MVFTAKLGRHAWKNCVRWGLLTPSSGRGDFGVELQLKLTIANCCCHLANTVEGRFCLFPDYFGRVIIAGVCINASNGAAAGGCGMPLSGRHLLSRDSAAESPGRRSHQATQERYHAGYRRRRQRRQHDTQSVPRMLQTNPRCFTSRVQTPGYVPKKPGGFFWVHPPKNPPPKKPTLLL